MAKQRRKAKTADEVDAFSKGRRFYHWRPGRLRRLKRASAKRERRGGKSEAMSWWREFFLALAGMWPGPTARPEVTERTLHPTNRSEARLTWVGGAPKALKP